MLCNITQNAMGQTPMGGSRPGPARGVPCRGVPYQGGTLPGGTQVGYPPSRVPPPQARSGWGGTQLGQQKEFSLHGGRYASCVHSGGLSCVTFKTTTFPSFFISKERATKVTSHQTNSQVMVNFVGVDCCWDLSMRNTKDEPKIPWL